MLFMFEIDFFEYWILLERLALECKVDRFKELVNAYFILLEKEDKNRIINKFSSDVSMNYFHNYLKIFENINTTNNFKGIFINFEDLLCLTNICLPPVPIARAIFFERVSDTYYNLMTDQQKNEIFNSIFSKLDLKNDDHLYFYNRFNPDNQFEVEYQYQNETNKIKAFKHNESFHVSKNRSIIEKYILTYKKI